MRKIFLLASAALSLALVACDMPKPNSNPTAAKAALEASGYTNVTNIQPLNSFGENCDSQESLYCNYFQATDRRGMAVAGVIAEEVDGELEIDHVD